MRVVRGERLSEPLILQLGFLVSMAIVVAAVISLEPAALSGEIVAAGVVASLAMAVVVVAPDIPEPVVIAFPLIDLVAALLVRHAVSAVIPAAGMLVLLPLLWLVYAFRTRGLVLALVGSVLAGAAALRESGLPSTGVEWARIYLLPALSLPILVTVSIAASRFRVDRAVHDVEEEIYGVVTEAIGAAVARIDRDGRPVALNEAAVALARRAGLWGEDARAVGGAGEARGSARAAGAAGAAEATTRIYRQDKVTPVASDRGHIATILGSGELEGVVYWVGRPGDQVAVAVTGRPLPDGGTLIVAHEVSELMSALESKEQIVRTIGHELKTPLTSIIGYADLIRGDVGDSAAAVWLEVIDRKAHDLARAIDDVLDVGREPVAVSHSAVDLLPLLEAAIRRADAAADERGVALETGPARRAARGALEARVDPARFGQLADILIENAVLYNRPEGRVVVSAWREGEEIVVEVADTGVGMSPADLSRAGELFHRSAWAEEQAIPGIGLGLSIAERIVRAHGGSLGHASEPGVGTTATVRLPAD